MSPSSVISVLTHHSETRTTLKFVCHLGLKVIFLSFLGWKRGVRLIHEGGLYTVNYGTYMYMRRSQKCMFLCCCCVVVFFKSRNIKEYNQRCLLQQKKVFLRAKNSIFGQKTVFLKKSLNLTYRLIEQLKKPGSTTYTYPDRSATCIHCTLHVGCSQCAHLGGPYPACIVWRCRCIIHVHSRHKAHDQKLRKASLKKNIYIKKNLKCNKTYKKSTAVYIAKKRNKYGKNGTNKAKTEQLASLYNNNKECKQKQYNNKYNNKRKKWTNAWGLPKKLSFCRRLSSFKKTLFFFLFFFAAEYSGTRNRTRVVVNRAGTRAFDYPSPALLIIIIIIVATCIAHRSTIRCSWRLEDM